MRKKLFLVATCAMLLMTTGCVKTPKLENGQEVIAEMDGKQITADELYNKLKENSGTSVLMDMIDDFIISKELENTDAEKVKAQAYVKQMKEYYEKNNQDWETALKSNNVTEDKLVEYYAKDYAKETIANNYYKSLITDDDINKYYNDEIIGDITAKQIVISSTATESSTADEKKQAETDAYNKAMEVIDKLKNGEDFSELAKQYSSDQSASEGGTLAPFNKQSSYSTDFINAAVALNPGEYTKKPVKTQYGYHIILVESKADKPSLDDVKETIISTLTDNKTSENQNYKDTAWKELRKKYNLNIHDTVINEKYDQTVSQY